MAKIETAEELTELLDRAGKEKGYLLDLRQGFNLRVQIAILKQLENIANVLRNRGAG